eukprot:g29537.t1
MVVRVLTHGYCGGSKFASQQRLWPVLIHEGSGDCMFGPSTRPCGTSSGCIGEVGLKRSHGSSRVEFGLVQYPTASVASAL